MKNKLLLLVGLLWAGCVPCWNPLYTDKDLVLDPLLAGTWAPVEAKNGSQESWVFSRGGEKLYLLQQTDEEGRKADFEARLVKLKGYRFLDLYLTKVENQDVKLNALATMSLVPAHLVLKIEQIGPTLKLAAMNPSWLKDFVKDHPDAIAHRIVLDGAIVLTADTSALQKFVLANADGERLFGGAMELRRNVAIVNDP